MSGGRQGSGPSCGSPVDGREDVQAGEEHEAHLPEGVRAEADVVRAEGRLEGADPVALPGAGCRVGAAVSVAPESAHPPAPAPPAEHARRARARGLTQVTSAARTSQSLKPDRSL